MAAQVTCNMRSLGTQIHERHADIPEAVRASLMPMVAQIEHLNTAIKQIDSDFGGPGKS